MLPFMISDNLAMLQTYSNKKRSPLSQLNCGTDKICTMINNLWRDLLYIYIFLFCNILPSYFIRKKHAFAILQKNSKQN